MSRLRALVLALACALATLTGCVDVPTSGPPQRIDGPAPPCQNCVNVEVEPPSFGDEPKEVVQGFLRATSIYQPNYSVAKKFLTKVAVEKWSPEDGAQIYAGSPVAVGQNRVRLEGRLVGSLSPDRSYTAQDKPLSWDFGLVKEDGEWRISRPPAGLMIADFVFPRFYTSYNIYFLGNGATLVPDPIYLPNLPNQANVAAVLMKALLSGPSRWLQPAVTSAIPSDTALSVDSVTFENGVAKVPLAPDVLTLNDRQRSLLAAQVVYTLDQAAGVERVLFQVNQKPFRVPQSDEDSLEVPVERIAPDVDPVPFVAGDQLYAVRKRAVQVLDLSADSPQPRALGNPLGRGKYGVDSLAVSVANTDIAAVTDGRTVLRVGSTTTADDVTTRLDGVTNLLRPQYSRYGELWAVGDSGGQQRMWVFNGDKPTEVAASTLAGGRITAFKISPDGARMALVRSVGARSELGLARIIRGEQITVDGWRPLNLSRVGSPAISVLRDVAWLDATDLLVLGGPTTKAPMLPYRLSQDASVVTAPSEPNITDVVEVAVLLGARQTSILVGRTGQTYKDDGTQWATFLGGCSTVAFPD
ncbi:MAG TPA: LpqB family beta-propeller domain-containing protein [Propionibacteriaceae bacterium]|nr:LpqB family beta-propeller domain-containing protein [Propionibacteriaceae bacterium]